MSDQHPNGHQDHGQNPPQDQLQDQRRDQRQDPAGRLTGDEAGWHNMHRNLSAAAAIAAAEAHAAGERRVSVEHPGASERQAMALDVLVSGVVDGQIPSSQVQARTSGTANSTTWRFTGPAANAAAVIARDLVDQANPGPWTVTADID